MDNQSNELQKIFLAENINVWSENQSVLEQQALKELEAFAEEQRENDNNKDDLEEGEIIDENKNEQIKSSLDIDTYIKRQEEFKQRQDFNKILKEETRLSEAKHTKVIKKRRKIKPKDQVSDKCDNEISDHKQLNTSTYCQSDGEESESEYAPSDGDYDGDFESCNLLVKSENSEETNQDHGKKRKRSQYHLDKIVDDGMLQHYKSRLDLHYKQLIQEEELLKSYEEEGDNDDDTEDNEYHKLKGGLKVPTKIWNKLYGYQQDSVKWLWKLHKKSTGGLLGDEMGLGKTVQIIAFLYSLEYSRISSCHGRFNGVGPSLIICPATVIHQWVKHFHEWAPEFRIAVLHQSGSFQGNKSTLIKEIHKSKGFIVTTYLGVIKYQNQLLDYNWHYVILDEGHKIRNPAAKATVSIKLFRTPHRLILTGSPMQNDLMELWSLFDFTNPGMLGNLKTFQEHFSGPILQGGFTNSTPMQEATALSVASTLKDIISPYLLRRTKLEVQHDISLPDKTEQVLFCSLTDEQKCIYKEYLMGDDVSNILGNGVKNWAANNHIRARVFVAITKLRKICNHPDIFLSQNSAEDDQEKVTSSKGKQLCSTYKRSGKMIVVSALLKIWKKQGHRVLLFTQGRSMINIFQDFLEQQEYKYLKMDGTTSIKYRQSLIEKFNTDTSYDVFLLTTRVGGLGINLTGANRVIIYDPDWNPATDTQARERAWRIGQDKQVTIYRLLSAGTIEEKMYQRQVWKQLLSNKILLDPKTNKFFKSSDLFDLFSLQESSPDANPETVNIFHNSRVRIQGKLKEQARKKRKKSSDETETCFTKDKIQQMKSLAQQIAKSLTKKPTTLQIELQTDKKEKEKERQEMKELEVGELLKYNKEKIREQEDTSVNKIDDRNAVVSFSEALQYSEKTAKLHNNLKTTKDIDRIVEEARRDKEKITKEPDKLIDKFKKKKRNKDKNVDTSGKIDGEQVQGLIKVEIQRKKHLKKEEESKDQDDFVLGKLLQKKGVSGAIQHESVIQEGSRGSNLRIHTEARIRAEKSLEALRKSRMDNWRW